MSKIFISYRRSDSADVAGRIFDHLRQHFGRDFLFKDVDSIPAGADFRTVIADTIRSCDVVIVIIGRGWLTATSKGARRLDDPEDYVRIEIETALERKIFIIPVLVGGAEMPSSDVLPASLQAIAFRNAVSVRTDPDFSYDVRRLVSALQNIVRKNSLLHRVRSFGRLRILLIIVCLVGTLLLLFTKIGYLSRIFEPANKNGDNAQRSSQSNEQPIGSGEITTPKGTIIVDARNGLMWTKSDNGTDINWHGAVKYCQDLSFGEYDDWQLPYKNELAATTDKDLSEVNRISKYFRLTRTCCFWTLSEETSDYAWAFDFSPDQETLAKSDQKGLRAICTRHYRK